MISLCGAIREQESVRQFGGLTQYETVSLDKEMPYNLSRPCEGKRYETRSSVRQSTWTICEGRCFGESLRCNVPQIGKHLSFFPHNLFLNIK